MFFELIGVILAGAAAALLFWAVNRALRGRMPSWGGPVLAGLTMLGVTIASEYGWADRTARAMPAGLEVAQTVEERTWWRPWTYVWPISTRFVAVDMSTVRTHPQQPGLRIVELIFFGRWTGTSKVPILIDCAEGRRADIADGVTFGADGAVEGVVWRAVPADDPVQRVACREE
ncbi:hypothetical protein DXV76_13245 [Rhodobacteraceae bacterium CCMM004]|nr:hypothetical protein DXV76_13245 [Rhodobacteraceae bacterium CCMM004]